MQSYKMAAFEAEKYNTSQTVTDVKKVTLSLLTPFLQKPHEWQRVNQTVFLQKLISRAVVTVFWPTFFVIMCTFSNELLNVRARRAVKVPDVSRHSGR